MPKADYPPEIQRLILHLKRLQGVGPRSAERMAVALLTGKSGVAMELARALEAAAQGVVHCQICGFFQSTAATCPLCESPERDQTIVCVVEQPTDVIPLERTGAYHGLYHVLGGRLSPERTAPRLITRPPPRALRPPAESKDTAHRSNRRW